jgi:potassium efflux system protein
VACLIVLALALPAVAQTEGAPERRQDLKEVRTIRAKAEADASLGDDVRARVLELYDFAISSLEAAADADAQAASLARETAGVRRLVEAMRKQLSRPEPGTQLTLPENATVQQAETTLARERARLSANRSALRDLERLTEERAGSRNETSRRLGALDQEIETLNDELRAAAQRDTHPELKNAARSSLLARQEAALHKVEELRAELALLDAQGALLPWQIDQAQRRVDHSEKLASMLEDATQDLRRRDAEESLRVVREQCREAADRAAALGDVAAETEAFAEMLWGPQGVMVLSEQTVRQLAGTRKHLTGLERIIQITRRKFAAFGHRGSISRWWPEIPDDFPEPGAVANAIRGLERGIPEAQHQLIRLEQLRSKARRLADRTLLELETDQSEDADPELSRLASELFNTRRELLDELIQSYGRHTNQLVELETVSRYFASELERVWSFLQERLLWVRSVPKPIIPRLGDIADAFGWLLSVPTWNGTFGIVVDGFAGSPGRGAGILILFGLLLGGRRWMRRRMASLAERVATPETDSFGATLEAFLYTVLLAAPLPLAFYFGSQLLSSSSATTFLFAAGRALYYLASVTALLELTRQLLAPKGLVEAHFGWPARISRKIHRGILWPEIVFLPLIGLALQLVMAGIRLDSPQQLQLYNNSLGRLFFIVAMSILGFSLLGLFRPRKQPATPGSDSSSGWLNRLYMLAYPAVALATLVPAALAVFGYYVTGILLAYEMLRTLWLLLGVLILGGLLVRWRTATGRDATRLSEEQADSSRVEMDLSAAGAQVRKLFRFVLVLIAAAGLYTIWSQALPTLQIMKRVELWPRVALIETTRDRGLASSAVSLEAQGEASQEATAESGDQAAPTIPGVPLPSGGDSAATTGEPSGSTPLTLWNLLEAVLAAMIATVLVKNVPGLLELLLARRTGLDRGARIALSTLIRYTIAIMGVSIAFGLLGISWSKIQWLAAALTFGLGFGLQEIVANFVSGLILLVERPVRVGDAVTIGNLQGRVSRIQIRATTITLWDRSEMIVPNKEFITTKLVNWTLSDSRRRVDIPLRVAFGSDLEKVREILVKVAERHPDVFDEPAPHVLLLEFGNDAIKFELRYYVDFGNGLRTRDELHMKIDRAFREQGIDFALPRLDIKMPGRGARTALPRPVPPSTESSG